MNEVDVDAVMLESEFMFFCPEVTCIQLLNTWCLPTEAVFRLRDKVAGKGLGGCRCSNDKRPRASPVACADHSVGCVAGGAAAGSVVGGVAVVTD